MENRKEDDNGGWPAFVLIEAHPKTPLHKQMQERGITNHRTVNYRSGIIVAVMQSIVGNTDANGRATRLPTNIAMTQVFVR